METTVIRIGNSRGIIIPASILKRMGVKEGAKVKLTEADGEFKLSFLPEEEPFTGPFTGPFKSLAKFAPDPDDDADALDIARELHDSRMNTREIPML